jgi:hypothetical protein
VLQEYIATLVKKVMREDTKKSVRKAGVPTENTNGNLLNK